MYKRKIKTKGKGQISKDKRQKAISYDTNQLITSNLRKRLIYSIKISIFVRK
ncbi:hypothetical protein HMPREF9148_01223 [Prevotella sp. F0091]|nr:hypothetical protein HMPREF9148_01223 [Prevotella sp. F0091]